MINRGEKSGVDDKIGNLRGSYFLSEAVFVHCEYGLRKARLVEKIFMISTKFS